MLQKVWRNKSNNQLCITIPSGSPFNDGDYLEVSKAEIKRIAYSGVVGDFFHYGHLQSLQFAKKQSDLNICAVLTDKAVEQYRAKPFSNLKERKSVISNLNCVDRVMIQKSRDPTENLKRIHEEFPNSELILIHGSDLNEVHGSKFINSIHGKILKHPYYKKLSTPKIIDHFIEHKDKFKDIEDFATILTKGEASADEELSKGNKLIISSKANTLKALKSIVKKSIIEQMYSFTVSDWSNNKNKIIEDIQNHFSGEDIVVRSSAMSEDTIESSMAGSFDSFLGVKSTNSKVIESAIKQVIHSYKEKSSESSFNQVLVQKQTKDIRLSGVLFTRTLEHNAPYYVINYDDKTSSTDSVTKGVESHSVTFSHFANIKKLPSWLKRVIDAVKEIEERVPHLSLDIEFAVNEKSEVVIFQARPLTTVSKYKEKDKEVLRHILDLKETLKRLQKPRTHLTGKTTFLADMTDWNPAEIIGNSPNLLDYSLYDYLITNEVWHRARTSQGYTNVDPAKLVVLMGNKPYIDVRCSFNSFLPASLSGDLKEKLILFYMDKLQKYPELQDKVEFDILFTVFEPDLDSRMSELKESGFNEKEIKELKNSLRTLTNQLIVHAQTEIKKDYEDLRELEKKRDRILSKEDYSDISHLLRSTKELLDNCKSLGTLQFSRLARLGFVAKILLKNLVRVKILSQDRYEFFLISINTVATEILADFKKMQAGEISRVVFINKYTHLRPGTYDITSPTYKLNESLIGKNPDRIWDRKQKKEFELTDKEEKTISELFTNEGLSFDARKFISFAKNAIEAREFAKFEFTKNLSNAIELIAQAGENMGFTRKEIAMLPVEVVFQGINQERSITTNKWKKDILQRQKENEIFKRVMLPAVIFNDLDLDYIIPYTPKPNFITTKKVEAKSILIKNKIEDPDEIHGKIVLIENGDPGYDWIFTQGIAGLITKYGGVASHMAIRCAEFGMPAAIGCGSLFEKLRSSEKLNLDCEFKKINSL